MVEVAHRERRVAPGVTGEVGPGRRRWRGDADARSMALRGVDDRSQRRHQDAVLGRVVGAGGGGADEEVGRARGGAAGRHRLAPLHRPADLTVAALGAVGRGDAERAQHHRHVEQQGDDLGAGGVQIAGERVRTAPWLMPSSASAAACGVERAGQPRPDPLGRRRRPPRSPDALAGATAPGCVLAQAGSSTPRTCSTVRRASMRSSSSKISATRS